MFTMGRGGQGEVSIMEMKKCVIIDDVALSGVQEDVPLISVLHNPAC